MYEQIGKNLAKPKFWQYGARLCHFIELFRRNEMLSKSFVLTESLGISQVMAGALF